MSSAAARGPEIHDPIACLLSTRPRYCGRLPGPGPHTVVRCGGGLAGPPRRAGDRPTGLFRQALWTARWL